MKKFIITEKLSNNLKNDNFLWLDFIKNSQKNDKKILKIEDYSKFEVNQNFFINSLKRLSCMTAGKFIPAQMKIKNNSKII